MSFIKKILKDIHGWDDPIVSKENEAVPGLGYYRKCPKCGALCKNIVPCEYCGDMRKETISGLFASEYEIEINEMRADMMLEKENDTRRKNRDDMKNAFKDAIRELRNEDSINGNKLHKSTVEIEKV